MLGLEPAPRLVMSYGIYNSPLCLETITSEGGDMKSVALRGAILVMELL